MIQDLRSALRLLAKERWFTTVAVLSLALGIGANTAIFSLINVLMLRMLPVREPQQLVQFMSAFPGEPRMNSFAYAHYERVRDANTVFSNVIGASPARLTVTREDAAPDTVYGVYVTGNFFSTLSVEPALGRMLRLQDDRIGGDPAVAVLSWSYWNSRYAGDSSILGRRIIVNTVPVTVVGVAARGFSGIEVAVDPDLWLPVAIEPLIARPSQRESGRPSMAIVARLRPNVSIEQAAAEMRVLDRSRVEDLARFFNIPEWRKARLDVEPAGAGTSVLRERLSRPLLALMAMVAVLLLLACVNIASLLLARGAAREREMALRAAIGASRWRLWRQVLAESLLLSAGGALIGIFVAFAGASTLVRVLLSGRPIIGLPEQIHLDVQPDLRVLLFTVGVAVVTGVFFGMVPAWSASSSARISSLREGGSVGERRSRRVAGRVLVVAQVALSIVMLSAAGLLVTHLSNLRNLNLGFDRHSVLLFTLDPSPSGYERLRLSSLYRDLLDRLHTIPGVSAATLSGMTPISGAGGSRLVNVEGVPERAEDRRHVSLNGVAPKYFATFGTPLIAGRDFAFEDEGRPPVAIVNQSFARHYFGSSNPIGRHFSFDGQDRSYEIVGVVGDAKYLDLYETPPRTIYLNVFQEGRGSASHFALRTDVAPTAVVANVRRAVNEVVPDVNVGRVTTLTDQLDASIVVERLIALLSTAFGVVGAVLAAIGLYGLLAYTVSRRTTEIGVRMALGATRSEITSMVVKSALGLVIAGLLIGAPLAALSPRFLARLVQSLTVEPPLPLVVAAVAMIAAGLVAAYVPARRAARVEPIEALRQT
ncbi:MAG TPA: ABC transporter permease [Vicinamibacterales bacterium]|nr:ABC transporter permease [Vicinamibacterales bacterium]